MLCGKLWGKYEQARTHFRVLYTWDGNGWKNGVWAAVRLWQHAAMRGYRRLILEARSPMLNIKTCRCYHKISLSKWGRSENRQACNLQKRTTTTLFLAGGWSRLLGHSCLCVIKEMLVLNGNSKYEFVVQNVHRTKRFPFIAVWGQETFLSCFSSVSSKSLNDKSSKVCCSKNRRSYWHTETLAKEYAVW